MQVQLTKKLFLCNWSHQFAPTALGKPCQCPTFSVLVMKEILLKIGNSSKCDYFASSFPHKILFYTMETVMFLVTTKILSEKAFHFPMNAIKQIKY